MVDGNIVIVLICKSLWIKASAKCNVNVSSLLHCRIEIFDILKQSRKLQMYIEE